MFRHTTTDMSRGWQFCLGGEWKENEVQTVCFPHPVTVTPAISSGGRNYQGKCIYRKSLFVPKEYEGKKIILEFEGLMGVSSLSVNGRVVKEHFCGYTPFVIDLSKELNFGADNLLQIDLDNSDAPDVPPGKPQADLDFTYEGGIYRKARISVSEPLYITHPLLQNEVAGGGIFVHYENVSEKSADVCVKVQVKNEYDKSTAYSLELTVIDASGEPVCGKTVNAELPSGMSTYHEQTLTVHDPELWSIDAPNLYLLRARIVMDGETVYTLDTEIGIRTFYFTINDGVMFNGVSHRFSGVNYHQTWPYIGNAVPDSLLTRDMIMLKEMGCENIRSHYPFSHAVTDTCNRIGMTLIVSNPGWQFVGGETFLKRSYQNVRDIVRWQRNNPCILIWEPILNESGMTDEMQQCFHDIVHEEYPYTDCYTASDFGPTDITYKDYMVNMIGDERYFEGKTLVTRPIWTREYGDAPDNWTDQNTVWRVPRGFGDLPQIESVNRLLGKYTDVEAQSMISYARFYNDKLRCGYGIWPGISHNRGYHMNPCYGGHLDLFRVPKFSYYFMKSQQDREVIGDVLFIANYWSDISPDDVMIFSNAERVELIVDGESMGIRTPDVNEYPVKHPPFTFEKARSRYKKRFDYRDVRSAIVAKAYVGDTVVAEKTVKNPGVPKKLRLEAETMGITPVADGADVFAVRCYVCDIDGQTNCFAGDGHPVYLEVEGEGKVIGDINILANPVFPESGVATFLVKTTERAGEIKLRARLFFDSFTDGSHSACAVAPDEITVTTVAAE